MSRMDELVTRLKKVHGGRLIPGIFIAVIGLIIVISLTYQTIDLKNITTSTSQDIDKINKITQHSMQPLATTVATKPAAAQSPLFGIEPTQSGAALNSLYTLIGTKFSPTKPDQAMAFIQTDSDTNDVYFIGDALPKGGTIESIGESSVTVVFRGIKEKLQLPWETITPSVDDNDISLPISKSSANINNLNQREKIQIIKEQISPDLQTMSGDQ